MVNTYPRVGMDAALNGQGRGWEETQERGRETGGKGTGWDRIGQVGMGVMELGLETGDPRAMAHHGWWWSGAASSGSFSHYDANLLCGSATAFETGIPDGP